MNKTPKNIESYSLAQILDLINDENAGDIPKKEIRYKIIRLVYGVLGYDISKDLLLALLAEPKAQLILATAGGGKTTFSQVKIVIEKILRKVKGKPLQGDKVLCLVYNKHNVKQMLDKQKQLVNKLYASGVEGLDIDSDLRAYTFHRFCQIWAFEFVGKTGLSGYQLLSDGDAVNQLCACHSAICKKNKLQYEERKVSELMSLYNLLRETLTDYENCDNFELFLTLQLPKDVVIETFKTYDIMKDRKALYDFTDMLHSLLKLLRTDETCRSHIQNYYDYIVADEVQDLTPIMMEILTLIKGDNTPLVCIGDEDQNIYGFRGASIENTLNFTNIFDGAEVYTLATNRRCGENIVDLSRTIVSWNTLRYEKDIEARREGGTIEYIPYNTYDGQMINLINRLKNMSERELNNTCICYRNRKSSVVLSDKLESNRLAFHVLSGYKPFSHEIYRHIIDILDMLYMPYDREYLINLYKICPGITRNQLFEYIGYNPKKGSWNTDREYKHFSEYSYGKFDNHSAFQKTLQVLTAISNKINTMAMKDYISDLFYLFDLAYWNSKAYLNKDEETDTLYRKECEVFFSSPLPYPAFYNEYSTRKGVFERNDVTKTGIALSTFHGLKGLEFDNVILIDLEDEIFPNFAKIDAVECYSEKAKLALKEGETRLFFVAVTRARDNLIMYYNEDCPPIYIDWLLSGKDKKIQEGGTINKDSLDIKKIFSDVGQSRESNLLSERMNMFDNLIMKVDESLNEDKPVSSELSLEDTDNLSLEDNEELRLDEDNDVLSLDDDEELSLEDNDNLSLDDDEELKLEDNDVLSLEDDEELSLEKKEPVEESQTVINLSENKEPPKFKTSTFMDSILDRI